MRTKILCALPGCGFPFGVYVLSVLTGTMHLLSSPEGLINWQLSVAQKFQPCRAKEHRVRALENALSGGSRKASWSNPEKWSNLSEISTTQ